jgi:hypothetical protein
MAKHNLVALAESPTGFLMGGDYTNGDYAN